MLVNQGCIVYILYKVEFLLPIYVITFCSIPSYSYFYFIERLSVSVYQIHVHAPNSRIKQESWQMDADEKLDSVPQLKELGNKLFKVITFLAVASSKNCDGALEHQLIRQLVITVLMQGGGYANKRLENTRHVWVLNLTSHLRHSMCTTKLQFSFVFIND